VVALIIAFLGAAVLDESPLTAIQLLYVNLIMDSLGSLALATEGPTDNVLDAMPIHKSASLLTPAMVRNVMFVAAY
jgi:magnesium-transporting ATPase (P-type)